MLPSKITEDQYKALEDYLKDEYSKGSDGMYNRVLDEKITNLKNKLSEINDKFNTLKTTSEQENSSNSTTIKELNEKLSALENEAGQNYSEIKSFWEDRVKLEGEKAKSQIDAFKGSIVDTMKDIKAKSLAEEIAIDGGSDLLTPHIKSKIDVNISDDGSIEFSYLDDKGKVSYADINEFKDGVKSDPRFKPVIRGSKASGSSDSGENDNQSPTPSPSGKSVLEMNQDEKLAYFREKRQSS